MTSSLENLLHSYWRWGEQLPELNLVPSEGDSDRAYFLYWLLYMATSGYMTAGRVGHPERYTVDESAVESVHRAAISHYDHFFGVIDQAISGVPNFLARGYSALDIYLRMLSLWHDDIARLYSKAPKVARLCQAVQEKPSFRTVMAEHMAA